MPEFGSFVMDLLDPPALVYDVRFGSGPPAVTVDQLGYGELTCAATSYQWQAHEPATGTVGRGIGGWFGVPTLQAGGCCP